MKRKADFGGWATKYGILCTDNRILKHGAFKHNDGKKIPLLMNHDHKDIHNVLGYAIIEHRDEGEYCWGFFNDSDEGQRAKLCVQHGDLDNLSIYANQLKESKGSPREVYHGEIREVSLVYAGANSGAYIDTYGLEHSDDGEFEAIIAMGTDAIEHSDLDFEYDDEDVIEHADEEKPEKKPEEKPEDGEEGEGDGETVKDVLESMNEKQFKVTIGLIEQAREAGRAEAAGGQTEAVEHSDDDDEDEDDEDPEVDDDVDEDVEDEDSEDDTDEDEDDGEEENEDSEGDEDMKHNAFEDAGMQQDEHVLTHADEMEIFKSMRACGSFKEALNAFCEENELEHTVTDHDGNTVSYGIADIAYLFPEARAVENEPPLFARKMDWVDSVINKTKKVPWSKIKSMYADITMDEARAKGYIKATQKADEVFALFKRETSPCMVYKHQKLDRQDIISITTMNIVDYLWKEMRLMIKEEIARAILIGDGRAANATDKINPLNIRPIWTDDEMYAIHTAVEFGATDTNQTKVNKLIDAAIEAQEDFEGAGNPVMYCTKWFLTQALLMRNGIGERIYKTKKELADELGVDDIIPVTVFKNKTRTVTVDNASQTNTLQFIVVDLADYAVGSDKGGELTSFSDFDIDYNQQKYLIETYISGALIHVKSAIVGESYAAAAVQG